MVLVLAIHSVSTVTAKVLLLCCYNTYSGVELILCLGMRHFTVLSRANDAGAFLHDRAHRPHPAAGPSAGAQMSPGSGRQCPPTSEARGKDTAECSSTDA